MFFTVINRFDEVPHLSPKVRAFIDELLSAWRPEPPWDRWEGNLLAKLASAAQAGPDCFAANP